MNSRSKPDLERQVVISRRTWCRVDALVRALLQSTTEHFVEDPLNFRMNNAAIKILIEHLADDLDQHFNPVCDLEAVLSEIGQLVTTQIALERSFQNGNSDIN